MQVCNNCQEEIPINIISLHTIRCRMYNYFCQTCKEVIATTLKDTHALDCVGGEERNRQSHDTHLIGSHLQQSKSLIKLRPKEIECEFCGELFLASSKHFDECVYGYKTVCCTICNQRVQRRHLAEHVVEHSTTDKAEKDLDRSQRSASLTPTMTCPTCSTAFDDYDTLVAHRMATHAWNYDEFKCTTCYCCFLTETELSLHQRYEQCK